MIFFQNTNILRLRDFEGSAGNDSKNGSLFRNFFGKSYKSMIKKLFFLLDFQWYPTRVEIMAEIFPV